MKLSTIELNKLSQSAISAARKAGQYIASQSLKEFKVNKKEGGDTLASQVFTEVDLKAQEIILNELQPTIDEFDLGLLTEESVDDSSRLEKDYFWCIDPLDGTLSFIEGHEGYAVSIALVAKNGDSVIGVVYNPVTKKMYSAVKGEGAYVNTNEFKITSQSDDAFTFSTDRSFIKNPNFEKLVEELEIFATRLGYNSLKLEKTSGAVINACMVVEKAPSCYFKFPKKENGGGSLWDFAASACIVKEAGAIVSDIFGNQLELNKADSTFMNHKGIVYASSIKIAEFVKQLNLKYGNA
ncbi:MAG: hypothetical protein PF517_04450 [Salinivirgaceae bacterium]|jgi:3'-phosphoadenosine 5'-phosphosulfate (PAPS) 3'-phosphatase|nr:hypothetical protein [Salinivirgaceae bacterium]